MTRALNFKREAEIDIQDAFDWYETRSDGLGTEFLRAVDAALGNIVRNPLGYQIRLGSIRRAPLRRFPYGMFFVVRDEDIVITACLHSSRDPAHWQRRS
ncbi:MAG: type II toxin-antitoxin system RelE/ParE family toxin [Rhizomicrobium sp.]